MVGMGFPFVWDWPAAGWMHRNRRSCVGSKHRAELIFGRAFATVK
jgi:hypothetical protein